MRVKFKRIKLYIFKKENDLYDTKFIKYNKNIIYEW
jgi:hypothetical protein